MQRDRTGTRAGARLQTRTAHTARLLSLAAALLVLALPGVAAAAAEDPAELVNPFIGTENFGNTFPGVSMPFGMVQVSPDNGGQGGYDYKRDYIMASARRICRASAAGSWASCR